MTRALGVLWHLLSRPTGADDSDLTFTRYTYR